MGKYIKKVGRSYGLIIDRVFLTQFQITPESELAVFSNSTALLIRKIKPGKETGKRLVKTGNSYAFIVPKVLLEMMEISPDSELVIGAHCEFITVRKKKVKKDKQQDGEDPMETFKHLDDLELSISERLELVDGKWKLVKPKGGNEPSLPDLGDAYKR